MLNTRLQPAIGWGIFTLLALIFGLVACNAPTTWDDEPLPKIQGPALLFFYTDG